VALTIFTPPFRADIWKKRYIEDFGDDRDHNEAGEPIEPSNWRKRFVVRDSHLKENSHTHLLILKGAFSERENKLNSTASRIRDRYTENESSKRDRKLTYTDKAPPPKRPRTGSEHTRLSHRQR